MLVDIFYMLLLVIIAIAASTKTLAMRRRFGILSKRLWDDFPVINKDGKYLVWIHAISVGETMAIVPLVHLIKDQWPEAKIVISSITETGHETAKNAIPFADYHVYLPFDFWFIINPVVKKVQPNLVILCETDFWYNFLRSAKTQGSTIVLINGRISDLSTSRYLKFLPFAHALFQQIDHFCVQNKQYSDRFESLGVPKSKITILKNIKLDSSFDSLGKKEWIEWKNLLSIKDNDRVIVCGSTHYPEEEMIVEVFKKISKKISSLKLILVPRHPDRCIGIAEFLHNSQLSYQLFSKIEKDIDSDIIVIDVMGKLRALYQLSNAAIVGGSFIKGEGGHNILEPACYGVPFIFGPNMEAQAGFVEIVKKHDVGYQISQDDLSLYLEKILLNADETLKAKEGAKKILQELKLGGSTQNTWEVIKKTLNS
jgi:3-deoxy-D-manno-octulosonic-acid transferase